MLAQVTCRLRVFHVKKPPNLDFAVVCMAAELMRTVPITMDHFNFEKWINR